MVSKDRPTSEPGGCECMKCGAIFIGGPTHDECGECATPGLLQNLRARKQAIAWSRGMDTDYPTKWEPDALCQQAADEIEMLRTQLAHWKVFAEHAEGERSQMSADAARLDRFEEWLADRAGPLLHIDDVRSALGDGGPQNDVQAAYGGLTQTSQG